MRAKWSRCDSCFFIFFDLFAFQGGPVTCEQTFESSHRHDPWRIIMTLGECFFCGSLMWGAWLV
jgi:hypothetical protein